jgi:ABC-type uncharacterized transport system permease subunit
MPHLWLRVAALLYGLGTIYALVALLRRREIVGRYATPLIAGGALFHLVSIAETTMADAGLAPALSKQSESILALALVAFYLVVYARYRTASHGLFVFPLATLLTLSAAMGQKPAQFESPIFRSGWVYVHITLIFFGYAALLFSFFSSLLYLLQERSLKAKRLGGFLGRLPSLAVIDDIGQRSLVLGFPFMTLGMIAGAVLAASSIGSGYFHDPKIVLSLLMWGVYMLLLFTRWTAGWRGRRAAVLSAVAFICATAAWAANYVGFGQRFTEH